MRTIRQQLLFWLMGSVLLITVAAIFAIYFKVTEESKELFDYQLEQIASAIPSNLNVPPTISESAAVRRHIVLQVWAPDGRLTYSSHTAKTLPAIRRQGFSNTIYKGEEWRIFSDVSPGRHVQVSQLLTKRNKLVYDASAHAVIPFLLLPFVFAIIITLVVRQVLAPLRQVVQDVEKRSANSLHPIPLTDIPPDIRPMINAINDLLARLDQSLSSQRAFVADASHELRSPLTAIKLQLQLAERAESEQKRTEAYRKLNERLDRSSHLIHQLLTLARHEPESSNVDFKTVDLVKLAQEVVADMLPFAESRSIEIAVNAEQQPVKIQGNRDWISIMLRNLIDNAIRYTHMGGNVEIDVSVSDKSALLKVTDNGPGIPAQDHQRVFDRFYRGEGETMQGSGLGLSIVQSIVIRHGGSIQLENASDSGGFSICAIFDREKSAF